MTATPATTDHRFKGTQADLRFGSNAVRLSGRQWAVAGAILVALFVLTPVAWDRLEPLAIDADYRMPYDLSNDYWQFARYADRAATAGGTLLVGDSVVWGQYVTRHETLSHYLNEAAGAKRFANLGLDGTHPVALAGLLDYYGGGIRNRNVVLHCNLLWIATAKHDLRTEKEFRFNHPDLAPQFWPRIPCYTEGLSRRIGIAVGRHVPFMGWADHLRLAYLDKKDLSAWTLEHPWENPLEALRQGPPLPGESAMHDSLPWTQRDITPQGYPWVDLETSLQWRSFRHAVETLRARGNRVLVVVGPFNEHMLTEKSRAAYRERRREAEAYLRGQEIPCFAPEPLPSEEYADASHPLAAGYRRLAESLLADGAFKAWEGP